MRSREAGKRAVGKSFEMSFEQTAEEAFERLYREGAVGPERVLRTVEAILDGLQRSPATARDRLLATSRALVLSAARHHRNLIEAGRALLEQSNHIASRYRIEPKDALDRILLGLAEGSCQVGPIVYSRLLEVATEYRDGAESWLRMHRRPSVELNFDEHPIIVPMIDDVRLAPPNRPSPSIADEAHQSPDLTPPKSWEAALMLEAETSPSITSKPNPSRGWSKTPGSRSLFRRFSDVLGQVFRGGSKRAPEDPEYTIAPKQNS